MKNYKKEFEELKEISIKLAEMARNHAIQKSPTTDLYNKCIKKMFDLKFNVFVFFFLSLTLLFLSALDSMSCLLQSS